MKKTLITTALALSCSISALAADKLPTKAEGFLWGVANAAFQVEGAPVDSNWRRWVNDHKCTEDGTNAEAGTDFWNRYEEDYKLAQQLGVNSFRVSVAWERIEPAKGRWDEAALAHYEKMFAAMRKYGLEPIVTIQHFTLPGWLADTGGLRSPDFVSEFAKYSEHVVKRLSAAPASVKWWMTFNEPMVMVNAGYLSGEWPPGEKMNANSAIEAAANIARAHLEAVRLIRALGNDQIQVSIAKHWRIFEGYTAQPLGWVASKLTDWAFNRQLMTALTTGKLFFWMPGAKAIREKIELPGGRPALDFLGVNYYGRTKIRFTPKSPFFIVEEGPGDKTDIGWEMYPEGMLKMLKDIRRYKLPIMVTENGVADRDDKFRAQFIRDHMAQMARGIDAGAKVIGYLHWSLTDNFEWCKGLAPRFGLVDVDYATMKKNPRPSFQVYKEFIK